MRKTIVFFAIVLLFGVGVNAETVVVGNIDWQQPYIENGKLHASDGAIFEQSNFGAFNIYSDEDTIVMQRAWIFTGIVRAQRFIVPSWQFEWDWSLLVNNPDRKVVVGTTSYMGQLDLNMYIDAQTGYHTEISFAGKNGQYTIEDPRLVYIFRPMGLTNTFQANLRKYVGNVYDANLIFDGSIPENLHLIAGGIRTTGLFTHGFTPNRLFVGDLNVFDDRIPSRTYGLALEVLPSVNSLSPYQSFQIGDTVQKYGTICDETWTAGTTIDVNEVVSVQTGCYLHIDPQVCVKFRPGTYIDNTASTSVSMIVDGNETNPIVFTSMDHNGAASGDFVCDDIGASDGVPSVGDYPQAIKTMGRNLMVNNAEFYYANTGIEFSTYTTTLTVPSLDVNYSKFQYVYDGISWTSRFQQYYFKYLDINAIVNGIQVNHTNVGWGFYELSDSNFVCAKDNNCFGLHTDFIYSNRSATFQLWDVHNNRFEKVKKAFDHKIQNQTGAIGPIYLPSSGLIIYHDVYGNTFKDSNYGIFVEGIEQPTHEGGFFEVDYFYDNTCENMYACIYSDFNAKQEDTYDGTVFYIMSNNKFKNVTYGIFLVMGDETAPFPSANDYFWTPDFNNNTCDNASIACVRYEIARGNGSATWDINHGIFKNNIFANSEKALWYKFKTNKYTTNKCSHNGLYNNTQDYNRVNCKSDFNASSYPFDIGPEGSLYLNDDATGGKLFRNAGIAYVDPTLSLAKGFDIYQRTVLASNYPDNNADGNIELGYHYPINVDLNILSLTPNGIYFTTLNGGYSIDFNIGSETYDAADILVDINTSSSTRHQTGNAVIQAAVPICDAVPLTPQTTCHYSWTNAGAFTDGNYFFNTKVYSSVNAGEFAYDAVDNNAFLDDTVPTIFITYPIDSETSQVQLINFTFTEANLKDIDVNFDSVESLVFNESTDCMGGVSKDCSYDETSLVLNNGYILTVKVTDLAGLTAQDQISFEYAIKTAPPSSGPAIPSLPPPPVPSVAPADVNIFFLLEVEKVSPGIYNIFIDNQTQQSIHTITYYIDYNKAAVQFKALILDKYKQTIDISGIDGELLFVEVCNEYDVCQMRVLQIKEPVIALSLADSIVTLLMTSIIGQLLVWHIILIVLFIWFITRTVS